MVTSDMFVDKDDDDFAPGIQVGAQFPALKALYQGKEVADLEAFKGEKGTVFVASRSFDWCPFCMRQLIQLQDSKKAYDDAGLGLVVMSYDAPGLQQAFIDKHQISIPLLSDVDTQSFQNLGILNTDYSPGDSAYGIPFPGMIVVNPEGIVVGSLFVEAYSSRVDAESALAYALSKLQ